MVDLKQMFLNVIYNMKLHKSFNSGIVFLEEIFGNYLLCKGFLLNFMEKYLIFFPFVFFAFKNLYKVEHG